MITLGVVMRLGCGDSMGVNYLGCCYAAPTETMSALFMVAVIATIDQDLIDNIPIYNHWSLDTVHDRTQATGH